MTILITGGAGYIGSVTTELLRARGEQVVVLDNLSRGYRDAVAPEIPFYEGNVGDRELVEAANSIGIYWGGHFSTKDGMHFEISKLP